MSSPNSAAPSAKPGIPPIFQTLAFLALAGFVAYRFPGVARSAIAFVIVLGILVFVHEWGHFQFARWAGMKVNRFALGFPPFIWNREKDGVTYSIGALPIGGMVDIAGLGSEEEMAAQSRDKVENLLEKTNIGAETDHAKARAEIYRDPSRPFGERQFQDAPWIWRFLTIFAGPLMNFLFAIILAIGLYSFWGVPDPTTAKDNRVGTVLVGSPADKGGLREGDLITGVGQVKTDKAEKITELIRASNEDLKLSVVRDGQPLAVTLKPEIADTDNTGKTRRMIGISFSLDPKTLQFEKLAPTKAVEVAFKEAWFMVKTITAFVARAFTFNLTQEDKQGVGGPLAIAQAAGKSTEDGGLYGPLRLMIVLSINLGLLNLLPLPALDGGRILFLLFELVARRPVPARIEGMAHAFGMVLLLTFMVFITMRDVVRFAGGGEKWNNKPKPTPTVVQPAPTKTP